MKHEVTKCDIGARRRSFSPPVLYVVAASLITLSIALTSQASEELSQAAISGTVPVNVSSTATQQTEKSAQDRENHAIRPLAPDASNSAVSSKIQNHGRAVKVPPNESFMINTIARKNPDGSISIEYVIGNENEPKALEER